MCGGHVRRQYPQGKNVTFFFAVLNSCPRMNADLIFARLSAHPILRGLTLDGVVTLTRLTSHLKRDILQPQSISESNPNVPPAILPQPIAMFLSASMDIPIDAMDDCWAIFQDYVWKMPVAPLTSEDYQLFKHHGWEYGLSAYN